LQINAASRTGHADNRVWAAPGEPPTVRACAPAQRSAKPRNRFGPPCAEQPCTPALHEDPKTAQGTSSMRRSGRHTGERRQARAGARGVGRGAPSGQVRHEACCWVQGGLCSRCDPPKPRYEGRGRCVQGVSGTPPLFQSKRGGHTVVVGAYSNTVWTSGMVQCALFSWTAQPKCEPHWFRGMFASLPAGNRLYVEICREICCGNIFIIYFPVF